MSAITIHKIEIQFKNWNKSNMPKFELNSQEESHTYCRTYGRIYKQAWHCIICKECFYRKRKFGKRKIYDFLNTINQVL